MKLYPRVPLLVGLTMTVLLSACGGGSGGGESGSQTLHQQQPSTATAAVSAPAAASAASAPEPAASASSSATAQAPAASQAGSPPQAASSAPTTIAATPGAGVPATSGKGSSADTASAAPPVTTGGTSSAGSTQAPPPAEQTPGAQIAAGTDSAPSTATSLPRCEIDQTKNFAGSCWANVKDSIPSGTNRSYGNARANYIGSVNANCIDGKVHWSTGLCRPASASADSSLAAAATTRPASSAYKIGTFYFPGWRDNQAGAPAKYPWARLKAYPEREPMLGWYDDGSVAVMEQQLKWMRSYGIDYVMFDWYWNGKAAALTHSVEAYLKTETKKDVPFALLWANHTGVPRTKLEFTSMVDYWIKNYFDRPEFLKIDGKPVIFVFSHPDFVKQAAQVGESYTALLNDAEAQARKAGHKGIYFIGGTHVDFSVFKIASTSGYSALSGYNYHGQGNDTSISYEELDGAYQNIWDTIVKNSSIPYILPMTQGWDKRPWGGSPNPLHDRSGGVLPEFERHLVAARKLMDNQPSKTLKMGIICCWNEFGEGSFIEPTKKDGFSYLEKVQKVFGSP